MATGVILNQSKNFEFIRFTQNPVIILAHKFAHDLEFVSSGADKINQPNYNNQFLIILRKNRLWENWLYHKTLCSKFSLRFKLTQV